MDRVWIDLTISRMISLSSYLFEASTVDVDKHEVSEHPKHRLASDRSASPIHTFLLHRPPPPALGRSSQDATLVEIACRLLWRLLEGEVSEPMDRRWTAKRGVRGSDRAGRSGSGH